MAQLASSKIYGDLQVTNDASIFGALNVRESISVNGTSFTDSNLNLSNIGTISASGRISNTSGGIGITGASTILGNLTVGDAGVIESNSGNLTIRSKSGAGTLNLNGSTLTVLSSGRLKSTYTSGRFIELNPGAASHIVTNLNADLLRGYTPQDFVNQVFQVSGSGVISGLTMDYASATSSLTMSSGEIFIKDIGFVTVNPTGDWSIKMDNQTAFQNKRSEDNCRWHAIIVTTVGNEDVPGTSSKTSVGGIIVYPEPDPTVQNPNHIPGLDVRPQKPYGPFTNPIVVAKIRYIDNTTAFSRQNIYPMRDFVKVSIGGESVDGQGTYQLYLSDQKNAYPMYSDPSKNYAESLRQNAEISSLEVLGSYTPRPMFSFLRDGTLKTRNKIEADGDIYTAGKISTQGGDLVDVSGLSPKWEAAYTEGHIHRYDISLSTNGTSRRRILFSLYPNFKEISGVYKNGIRLKAGSTNDYTTEIITGNQGVEIIFADPLVDADNVIVDIIESVVV